MAVTASYKVYVDFEGTGSAGVDGSIDALTGTIDSYGATTIDATITLSGPDNVTADVRHDPATALGRGRDQARSFAPPVAGLCDFALENDDARYSSANAASPLAGNLKPGREVLVQAIYAGTTYPLYDGFLDIPTEQPARTLQRVRFSALDGLARLMAFKNVSTPMYTDLRTDQAIGYVLDAASWPAAKRLLDTGKTTLARWWVDGMSAFEAIRELVFTEGVGALGYVDESGNFVFESRHYRLLNARSTGVQATFRGRTTEPLYKRFEYEPGLKGIVNACTVPVRSYASTASVTVWTASGLPLTLGANEVRTFKVSTTADGFSGATVSVTASPSVTTQLDRTSGKTATLTLTAPAGGSSVTALSVVATTWAISETLVSETIDASASWDDFGLREFPSSFIPPWIPTAQEAQDFCNAVVSRYKDPRAQVRFSVTNGHETRIVQALSRKISDRVRVVEDERAKVDDEFTLEAISHLISEGGLVHETTFSGEQADNQAFWVLGDAVLGLLGDATVLGY